MEVMVALVVGTVMVGGIMGLISVSLQYMQRVNEKSRVLPVLEAAASQMLANPEEVEQGSMKLKDFGEGVAVDIALTKVLGKETEGLGKENGQLYRVQLRCRGQLLEFSMIIPQSKK